MADEKSKFPRRQQITKLNKFKTMHVMHLQCRRYVCPCFDRLAIQMVQFVKCQPIYGTLYFMPKIRNNDIIVAKTHKIMTKKQNHVMISFA